MVFLSLTIGQSAANEEEEEAGQEEKEAVVEEAEVSPINSNSYCFLKWLCGPRGQIHRAPALIALVLCAGGRC